VKTDTKDLELSTIEVVGHAQGVMKNDKAGIGGLMRSWECRWITSSNNIYTRARQES